MFQAILHYFARYNISINSSSSPAETATCGDVVQERGGCFNRSSQKLINCKATVQRRIISIEYHFQSIIFINVAE